MNAKLVSSCAVALLLTGTSASIWARDVLPDSSPADRGAAQTQAAGIQTFVAENLTTGTSADVYRVSCTAECIRADVNDAGPFDDTRFKVDINGSSSGFVGSASAINPTGGISLVAELCSGQNVNAARRAYVTFTEVNAAGIENYDTVITCRTATNTIINPTIVKILDQ